MFRSLSICLSGVLLGLVLATPAAAGEYRIRFQGFDPATLPPNGVPQASGYIGLNDPANLSVPTPSTGGAQGSQYQGAGVPNQIVTFMHPFTGRAITIPLTLPTGRPTIRTRSDRIVYDYGLFSYKVIVRFLPDGEVEVIYRG